MTTKKKNDINMRKAKSISASLFNGAFDKINGKPHIAILLPRMKAKDIHFQFFRKYCKSISLKTLQNYIALLNSQYT
jgi:hypothetical protein